MRERGVAHAPEAERSTVADDVLEAGRIFEGNDDEQRVLD
jgi:hypothetical protein